MKRIASITLSIALSLVLVAASATTLFAESPGADSTAAYGSVAALAALNSGVQPSVEDMLRWAAEDEYLARAEYDAIMAAFGRIRPYTNIRAAEETHLSWLRDAYAARGLPFPVDGAVSRVVAPRDLKAAAQAGVDAEIANIAMYDAFLALPIVNAAANGDLKLLFQHLRDASKNHLAAFRTQLSRY